VKEERKEKTTISSIVVDGPLGFVRGTGIQRRGK
jgi:hypothetical protein